MTKATPNPPFVCNRCNLSAWRVVVDKEMERIAKKMRKKQAFPELMDTERMSTYLELQCISCEKHGGHNNIKVVVTGVCL